MRPVNLPVDQSAFLKLVQVLFCVMNYFMPEALTVTIIYHPVKVSDIPSCFKKLLCPFLIPSVFQYFKYSRQNKKQKGKYCVYQVKVDERKGAEVDTLLA